MASPVPRKHGPAGLELINEESLTHGGILSHLPPNMLRSRHSEQRADAIGAGALGGWLAKDVFHFVEDRGISFGRTVLHFECGAQLFEQLALFARQL